MIIFEMCNLTALFEQAGKRWEIIVHIEYLLQLSSSLALNFFSASFKVRKRL